MSDEYGREFLSAVITRRARETPHRVFMSLARSADLTEGFEDLSYGRFAQAVDRCVFWLEATVGKNENSSAPRAIFASLPRHDLRAVLLILAAPKTGHQVIMKPPPPLPLSPRANRDEDVLESTFWRDRLHDQGSRWDGL